LRRTRLREAVTACTTSMRSLFTTGTPSLGCAYASLKYSISKG
jgi:hypothetical protein